MQRESIILMDIEDNTYAFGSLKKASEIFKWIKLKYVYNKYYNNNDFTYKGVRFRKIPFY